MVAAAGLVATPASAESAPITTSISETKNESFAEAFFGSDLGTLDMPESARQAHPVIVRLLETDVPALDDFEAKRLYAELESSGELGFLVPVSGRLNGDKIAPSGEASIAAIPLWILRAAGRMVVLGSKIAGKYRQLKKAIKAGEYHAVRFMMKYNWSRKALIWAQKALLQVNPSSTPVPLPEIAVALYNALVWIFGLSLPSHENSLKSESNAALSIS